MMQPKSPDGATIDRRTVLKAIGASGAILGGGVTPTAAKRGTGPRPLESSPSNVAYVIFAGQDIVDDDNVPPGDGSVDDVGDFGGLQYSAAAEVVTDGSIFNTTQATVTPNGGTLHYHLPYDVDHPKPYVLRHDGNGQYTSRGAVSNFEISDATADSLLGALLGKGSFRATVRDVVQLYGKGGSFDWSVSRTDFFSRDGELTFERSLLTVVWDLDGPDNDQDDYRGDSDPGSPVTRPPPKAPTYPTEPKGTDTDIEAAIATLVMVGVSTSGGQ